MQIPPIYKKVLAITGFLLITGLIAALIYMVFFKAKPEAQTPSSDQSATSSTGRLPEAGPGTNRPVADSEDVIDEDELEDSGSRLLPAKIANGGLTQTSPVISRPIKSLAQNSAGNGVQFYDELDGKFYQIDASGSSTPLSDKAFHNVSAVTWAPNGAKAVIEYPDAAKIIYNFQSNKQITLPKHWEDIGFSPDSNKLVLKSVGLDPNNRWLAISDDQGANARTLASLGEYGDTVIPSWSPNGQSAAMFTESAGLDRQKVYFVGLNNENFKSLTVEGRGFEHLWNPSGDYVLYSVYSSTTNLKPELWITKANGEEIGQNRKRLNLETWAHKCVFASDTSAYCAVPETLEAGAGMVPELSTGANDQIFKIDIQTGAKNIVAIPDGKFSIQNLTLANEGSDLYFSDSATKNIYKIKLK